MRCAICEKPVAKHNAGFVRSSRDRKVYHPGCVLDCWEDLRDEAVSLRARVAELTAERDAYRNFLEELDAAGDLNGYMYGDILQHVLEKKRYEPDPGCAEIIKARAARRKEQIR